MYQKTLSYYSELFYRNFAAYTGERLRQIGLNFGYLFFVVYIGKKPKCSPSDVTRELKLDWGHCQRSLDRLVADGFVTREKAGRSYSLTLTEKGQEAFEIAHQVFFDWDEQNLTALDEEEKNQLLTLLQKAAEGRENHV